MNVLARGLALCVLGAVGLVSTWVPCAQAADVPRLGAHVNDYASLLPSATVEQLEGRLQRFQEKTGHQYALLIVPSLDGLPIEEYAIKVATAWKLGDKARDDGLVMVIAQGDRKMRIEVGYGLEGDITDALSARVLREVLQPAFRRGDYAYGVSAAFDVLIRAAGGDGEQAPQPTHAAKPHPRGGGGGIPVFLIVVVVFVVINALTGGFSRGRRRGGGFFPIGFGGGGGGWGGGGGGWGGGGGGGGGFSGGGGGFGGGGASGDW